MRRDMLVVLTAGVLAGTQLWPQGAGAQTAGAGGAAAVNLPDVTVVGSTPLLGSGLDRDQIPAATNVLGAQDIDRTGIPSLTGAILDNIAGASLNDVEGNGFQPDILFRGFIASPVKRCPGSE